MVIRTKPDQHKGMGNGPAIFTKSKTRLRTPLLGNLHNTGKLSVCQRKNQFRKLADMEMTK